MMGDLRLDGAIRSTGIDAAMACMLEISAYGQH